MIDEIRTENLESISVRDPENPYSDICVPLPTKENMLYLVSKINELVDKINELTSK